MAYDRVKIFEQAKDLIEKNKLFFVEDIVALLPCDKTTFYRFFEPNCNEYNTLKEMLDKNRVEIKSSMRSKWYKSDAPALQIALMKIISTDEEAHRLNGTKTVNQTEISGEIKQTKEMTLEQAKEIQKKLDEQV